jgi:endonuclease/exonuclease/phosphatase (EEP) superfamily protein YafD
VNTAEVVNSSALIGVAASDHEPVVATFTVR